MQLGCPGSAARSNRIQNTFTLLIGQVESSAFHNPCALVIVKIDDFASLEDERYPIIVWCSSSALSAARKEIVMGGAHGLCEIDAVCHDRLCACHRFE